MKTKAGIILLGQGEGIMKTKARIILLGLVMVIAFCYVNFANAESNFATGAGPQSADASLDFQIVIPKFIYFRVGTAGIGSIDTINFNPTVDEISTGGITTGAPAGGAVAVSLVSNGGTITITTANDGSNNGLADGLNYISYDQINTLAGGTIPAPDLTNAGAVAAVVIPSADITVANDIWTYTYSNPGTPPVPGTYTGRVTYTAAIL